MRALALFLVGIAGCGALDLDNGKLACSTDHRCPDGYHCAADDHCWQNGTDPAPPDAGAPPDLSMADLSMADLSMNDLSMSDLSTVDAAPPPDLFMYDLTPIIVPPASVWISSGGGAGDKSNTSSDTMNWCIGGSVVLGGGTGTANGTLTLGYFASDTY